ncbi:zona pellucida-like domain-containing protein 1 [Hoplias malabaricus]|uniref:zona pellucida-like domain-containing protein 1 n=1 Tax=Hoplias malabaricus TaxID=27720 RepID=UPI003462DDE3
MAFFSLFIFGVFIPGYQAITLDECGDYARHPAYTDISVSCGTQSIELNILACPVIYTGYNESLLILNQMLGVPGCRGQMNTSVTPPVVRFTFPLRPADACGSVFVTTSTTGTGIFSEFSSVQTMNISGVVRSFDPTMGAVTYNAELKYIYSCAYPLEYLINNTILNVASSSIAVKDNNGTFISTLSMQLFKDSNYTVPLIIPPLGIELKTTIFVQVIAVNLTAQYNVLLDRCYASISPQPSNSTYFNLFVACSKDQFTTITENGITQRARFSFPAFRFSEQQNQTVSTYYLHCITRLCDIATCTQFKQCGRKRREVETETIENGMVHITSVPISTRTDKRMSTTFISLNPDAVTVQAKGGNSGVSVGLAVAVTVLVLVSVITTLVVANSYHKLRCLHCLASMDEEET